MTFITGLIAGFFLFPVVCICAILVYGYKAGWDKPTKNVEQPTQNVNIEYLKYKGKGYIDKKEINKIINKSKMC